MLNSWKGTLIQALGKVLYVVRSTRAGLAREQPGLLGLLVLCGLALAVRLWLSWASVGSNDISTWQYFGDLVSQHGVIETYRLDGGFNHPPLMGYWAAFARVSAKAVHLPFPFVFKLLPITASVLTVFAICRNYQCRWPYALLFAASPVDILVSSYHGNTDTFCVALCAAALIAADKNRALLGGVLLGAAINVKLIPVIAIVPMLASFQGYRARLLYLVGLATGVVPFLAVLYSARDAFVHNAIQYNSFRAYWGFGMLAYGGGPSMPNVSEALWRFVEQGKYFILGGTALYALLPMLGRTVQRAQYLAFALSTFLVFASGFGPQYLVYPIPFLLVVRPRLALTYAYLAGGFAFLLYYWYWTKTFPMYSSFNSNWPDTDAMMLGFATWCVLAKFWVSSVGTQLSGFVARVDKQYRPT